MEYDLLMEQAEKLWERLPPHERWEYGPEDFMPLLQAAEQIIQERRHPFGTWPDELEPRYYDTQIRIGIELFSKRGAEGQTAHSENGTARTWAGADVSPDLLAAITPKVGLP